MNQLSDNTTASLALHINIIPDIPIIISFSQTQGPNTGSVSVTKKNWYFNEWIFLCTQSNNYSVCIGLCQPTSFHIFFFNFFLLSFTLHNKLIPSILKYAMQIWQGPYIQFLNIADLWVTCYNLLLLCKWKKVVLWNAQVFHSQILLEV